MHIIGITGTIGAGKGTVVEHLITKGFKHYSARSVFLHELAKRGLPNDRNAIRTIANELRQEHGPAFVAEELLKQAQANGADAVIESLRTLGEIEALRQADPAFVLLAVDADQKTRYERIIKRGSETDSVTFDEFVVQEEAESNNSDPWKQNLPACIAQADVVIRNDGTIDELNAKIDAVMGEMG